MVGLVDEFFNVDINNININMFKKLKENNIYYL